MFTAFAWNIYREQLSMQLNINKDQYNELIKKDSGLKICCKLPTIELNCVKF